MRKISKDELVFLPLGGSNEIGMNVNLYHYKGKWIMIDLGAGFADERFPGIDMLAPDLSFIYENRENFLGLVLTHAHEDHLGSLTYLWEKLRCPIYATPFTAGMAQSKLIESGLHEEAKITVLPPENGQFKIGPFELEMVHITHSIPEMNGVIIKTEHGNIFHTGDWKLDPDPVVGGLTNDQRLKQIGDEGVLAMVCDSTNVFNDRHSGSEGELVDSLTKLISGCSNLVVVTTFASNVARMHSIAVAARNVGRRVITAGWSLRRISMIARETGYLQDIPPFLEDKEINNHPRNKLLVMCTGCQGEPEAAMNRIAHGTHPTIRLKPEDTVIFSSKIIPGNEKKIFKLFNRFVRTGCEVYTEKDHLVHVSGHPSRQELTRMYQMVRPKIAIPVHGEPIHLHEHCKLARELGVEKAIEIQNGLMIKLAPGDPESIGHVKFGYLGVDGKDLHPEDGEVLKMRRRLMNDGIIFASLVLTMRGKLASEPLISAPGVIDYHHSGKFMRAVSDELVDVIEAQRDSSDDNIYKATRTTLKRIFKERTGKTPPIEIQISRV